MAPLWIIGMMGAGKTTVGRLVAKRLQRPFLDLDEAIAAAAGQGIPEVFSTEGEAGFRRRESVAVEAAAGTDAVVAAGGGVVLDPGNVARMRGSGLVVWLQAPVEVLASRVGEGRGRPLLAGEPGEALGTLLASRAAAYEGAAHRRVDTAGREPAEVAEEVVRCWSEFE